jgi:hypothetical protein
MKMKAKLFLAMITATAATTAFAAELHGLGYSDTPLIPGTKWHIHDGERPQPKVVTPGQKFSEGATAPSDASVLFDGKDLSKWQSSAGGDAKWKVENGYMETTKTGKIRTKEEWGDFQLHLEWATPEKVEGTGQGRGNNGINIYGRYEIQVLDSYNNPTYPDGQAAAVYGQTPPLVNASRGPGQWQTYDIMFETPRWDVSGKLIKKGNVTVLHNGVLVQHKTELMGGTTHRAIVPFKQHPPHGYLELYEHGNAVRFKNIWIRPIGELDKP